MKTQTQTQRDFVCEACSMHFTYALLTHLKLTKLMHTTGMNTLVSRGQTAIFAWALILYAINALHQKRRETITPTYIVR